MLQEPLVELGIRVSAGVGIVSNSGVNREPGVSLGGLDGCDHLPGALDRHHAIIFSVKGPDRKLANAFGRGGISSTADWGGRGEAVCVLFDGGPCSVSPHAEAGEIHPLGIDVVGRQEVVEKDDQIIWLPATLPGVLGECLGRDHDEFKIIPFVHQGCQTVGLDLFDVSSTPATAMQVNDEWHRLRLARAFVRLGEVEPELLVEIFGLGRDLRR